MAVKINNTASLRKAKRWSEQDDAALCLFLKRKIKDVNVGLRESESPYERARLKEQKRRYKSMLVKVESGVYNGDLIFSEIRAAAALQAEQNVHAAPYSTMAGGKRYVGSYENMDFDYESAFRKKRYYGAGLPIILLILSIVFLAVFIMSAFIPADVMTTADENGFSLNSMFVYKLGPDTVDIEITNSENTEWPAGAFAEGYYPLEKGEVFTDAKGNTPDKVKLNADLGMTAIYISPFDIVKAWFRTPMLEKTRIDFLEDNALFQGDSYYYLCFLSGSKRDALIIQKDEDGNFDNSVIFRHIGSYGTIIFLLLSFILGVVSVVINIVRIFTYTSRRIHVVTILSLISSLFLFICPALATIEGTDIGGAFSAYFSAFTDFETFLTNAEASAGLSILMLVPVILNVVMLILPLLFKNRLKKRQTYVPLGNRRRWAIDDPLYTDEETLKELA